MSETRTEPTPVDWAKELLRVERQLAKVKAIYQKLQERRAELLDQLK